eukprot:116130-Rhodomonas_salina.1
MHEHMRDGLVVLVAQRTHRGHLAALIAAHRRGSRVEVASYLKQGSHLGIRNAIPTRQDLP